jgi:hypothetical protein
VARRSSVRGAKWARPAPHPANDDAALAIAPKRNSPANDNPSIHNLPTCLAVTDDEVMLLHRYLSRDILALFG